MRNLLRPKHENTIREIYYRCLKSGIQPQIKITPKMEWEWKIDNLLNRMF